MVVLSENQRIKAFEQDFPFSSVTVIKYKPELVSVKGMFRVVEGAVIVYVNWSVITPRVLRILICVFCDFRQCISITNALKPVFR